MATAGEPLKTTQILVLALIGGVAAFAIVVAVVVANGFRTAGSPSSNLTLAFPLGMLGLAALVLPIVFEKPIAGAARRGWEHGNKDDDARRAVSAQFQVLSIVRAAIPEAFGLFAVVATLITGELAFLVGAGLAIAYMLGLFPTAGRWADFYRNVTSEELFLADRGETHDR